MPVRRGNKWEGRLKIGGKVVKTRRFERKGDASAWERRQRQAFDDLGFNPANGKELVEALLPGWLESRATKVSPTTLKTDGYLLPTAGQKAGKARTEPVLPPWFRKMKVASVTSPVVERWQDALIARGLAPTSVKRHRESLSSFFAWCVQEGHIGVNPVKAAKPPKDQRVREPMRPFPEFEFNDVAADIETMSGAYADLVRVLGRTGLRWGEVRAMRVRDFIEEPMPMLRVVRNQPEGIGAERPTKSYKPRNVPLSNEIYPLVRNFAAGKKPDDLLFMRPSGGQLHRSMFIRHARWQYLGRGRTIHDLRHTAACFWLMSGVPLGTVQAWLGHAHISTTSRYLHHLGESADRAGLDILNRRGDSGVTEN